MQQAKSRFKPCEGTVGVVEYDHVNACVRQQLRLPAKHPFVRAAVVAVDRFIPKMIGKRLAPFRSVRILGIKIGVFIQNLLCVVGVLMVGKGSVPCPVKHAYKFSFPRCSDLVGSRKSAADRIGCMIASGLHCVKRLFILCHIDLSLQNSLKGCSFFLDFYFLSALLKEYSINGKQCPYRYAFRHESNFSALKNC